MAEKIEQKDPKEPKEPKEKKDKKSKDEDEGTKEKQPMTMKKVIILMSAAFISILVITVVALVLILKPEHTAPVTNDVPKETSKEEKKSEVKGTSNQGADEAGAAEGKRAFFYSIKPVFIVNLDSNRVKFLQIGVDIMAKKQETITKITDNLPIIKNELVTLFSNKGYEQVKTVDGREALRREALKIIKQVLEKETSGDSGIDDVLFTSFVMQ